MNRFPMTTPLPRRRARDPEWYKDAILYELRVRSFYDGDGDGVGDFKGLTEKLDYLQDLGITALWLLPFYPSPQRDDGYDISGYTEVHPELGTLDDFKRFLDEAHRRGLHVITELVINHTSDQHPWFQRARRAPPGSPERAFYVWSDTPDRYREARIIFKDFELSNWTWDPIAKAYFWHRFYSHQPDLNFESPEVERAVVEVMDFWLSMGVDGLRLDAVPYLFEREGTNCENLPETHAFLRRLRAHVDARYPGRMLLAEANQWPEDAIAYFGRGDECHMAFHFPIMPRIFMSIHMEDRFPILDILAQTPAIPDPCQWALFLRNHDELTLEMVTDEERDYMYRAYAKEPTMRINLGIRRRLAPLVGNDRRNIELMNGLLFSLPGTPVLYYGDEIGMGDNVYLGDRNGVRTPMQWSSDRNAGFSRVNPQRLVLPVIIDPEYHYESINVEAQQNNPSSLLWWTKRLIALRKRFAAFGRGSIEFLRPDNPRVLAFVRQHGSEIVLVVANLSRFAQFARLDLERYRGMVPIELSGRTEFPAVGAEPYVLTLGGHAFHWFSLELPRRAEDALAAAYAPPAVEVTGTWEAALAGPERAILAEALVGYLVGRRWFEGRDRRIEHARIVEAIPIGDAAATHLVFLHLDYAEGDPEQYFVPVAFKTGERAAALRARSPQAVVAELRTVGGAREESGLVVDALDDDAACRALLEAIVTRAHLPGAAGEVVASGSLRPEGDEEEATGPRSVRRGPSGTAVVLGDRFFLRVHRRLDEGRSPDLEIAHQLAARHAEDVAPRLAGAIEYRRAQKGRAAMGAAPGREPSTLAVLRRCVDCEGYARAHALSELGRFFERALVRDRAEAGSSPARPGGSPLHLAEEDPPALVRELMGNYLDAAAQIGRRLGAFHAAMAASIDDPAFAPEPHSSFDQRSVYQTMRNQSGRCFRLIQSQRSALPPDAQAAVDRLLLKSGEFQQRIGAIMSLRLASPRVRVHGAYRLEHLLYTGKDFLIADFEGDSRRPLAERRRKSSPLRDVASMITSLHEVSFTALLDPGLVRSDDRPHAEPWAELWRDWASSAFLRAYLASATPMRFLPTDRTEMATLLDAFLLESAVVELHGALHDGPSEVLVPLLVLGALLDAGRR